MQIVAGMLVVAIVVAVAAWLVIREAGRIAKQPPPAIFDLDEAHDWVVAQLPDDVGIEAAHDRGDVVTTRTFLAGATDAPVRVERRDRECGQMPMRCASSSRWYVGSPR